MVDICEEWFQFQGNADEFARAVEQSCYDADGKGVQVLGSESMPIRLPKHLHGIVTAENNLLIGLRSREIVSLFQGAQLEEWRYLSRDRIHIDGVVVSINFIYDHIVMPPEPPLWKLDSNKIAAGYCIRIPTPGFVLSLCLHAVKICTGPSPATRRVEFRAMMRDPEEYTEEHSNRFNARIWESQKVFPALTFDLSHTANGKTKVHVKYCRLVKPFYEFIINDLIGLLIHDYKYDSRSKGTSHSGGLPGHVLEELHDTILHTFSEFELTKLLRMKLEKDYTVIANGENYNEKVFHLLGWVERHGCLDEMINAMSAERPKNEILLKYSTGAF